MRIDTYHLDNKNPNSNGTTASPINGTIVPPDPFDPATNSPNVHVLPTEADKLKPHHWKIVQGLIDAGVLAGSIAVEALTGGRVNILIK